MQKIDFCEIEILQTKIAKIQQSFIFSALDSYPPENTRSLERTYIIWKLNLNPSNSMGLKKIE